jgi:hypothetical protein
MSAAAINTTPSTTKVGFLLGLKSTKGGHHSRASYRAIEAKRRQLSDRFGGLGLR